MRRLRLEGLEQRHLLSVVGFSDDPIIPAIDVGDHVLLPDTAGQEIEISVTGGVDVEGLDFFAKVADGGEEMGGVIDGPAIEDLDILTGTIFGANNTGVFDEDGPHSDTYPQVEARTTTTTAGTVATTGLLATVTIDTTGFTSGTWGLSLSLPAGNESNFAGIAIDLTDGTITIPSVAENSPPVANDDSESTDQDVAVNVDVLANDTDADGDPLTITIVTSTNGAAVVNDATTPGDPTDDTVDFMPGGGFSGDAEFTYTVNDGTVDSNEATVAISVAAPVVNTAPVANDDSESTDQDVPVNVDVLANDTDADADPLTITIVTSTDGAAVVDDNGTPADPSDDTVLFTPDPDFSGAAGFTYTVNDGTDDSNEATVAIEVTAVSDTLAITVADHELLPDTAGQVVEIYVTGGIDVAGVDVFVRVADGGPEYPGGTIVGPAIQDLDTLTGTIFADNNSQDPNTPVFDEDGPHPDAFPQLEARVTTTNVGTVTASGLLATITIDTTGFTSGTWDLTLSLSPGSPTKFVRLDASVVPLELTNGTITIPGPPVNTPPVADDDTGITTAEDTAVSVDVLANDTDADGDPLTIAIVDSTNGSAVVDDNGTPADPSDDTVLFTPDPDFNGAAGFTYTVNDGTDDSNVATVSIEVTPVSDMPLIDVGDHELYADTAGQSIEIFVTGGQDVEGLDIFVQVADGGPADGGSIVGPAIEDLDIVTGTIFADNNTGENGDEGSHPDVHPQLEVRTITTESGSVAAEGLLATVTIDTTGILDGTFDLSLVWSSLAATTNFAGVEAELIAGSITVVPLPLNEDPVANDDAGSTLEDTPVTVDVLANDTDADLDPLTITIVDSTNGTATVNDGGTPADPTDDTVDFAPDADFNGTAGFTYQVNDGIADSNVATVTIEVAAVNDAPVANDDAGSTLEDTPVTVDVLANDTDVDGDPLTITIVDSTSGTATINEGGTPADPTDDTVDFAPDAEFNGTAGFTYQVNDGTEDSNVATVTIDVAPVNDAPGFTAGADQTGGVDEQVVAEWATDIVAGPADESGQVLTFQVTNDNSGLFAVEPAIDPLTGDLTYTLAADADGSATVTVVLADDGGTDNGGVDASAPQEFTITAGEVNDAPSFNISAAVTAFESDVTWWVPNWATEILPGPPDEAGQSLEFVVVGNTAPELFAGGPTVDTGTGTLTFTPAPDAFGAADITLVLRDDGGTENGGDDVSDPVTFRIAIRPVNDAPSFRIREIVQAHETDVPWLVPEWATEISAGPANESDQALEFIVTENTNEALFAVAPAIDPATGDMTFTFAADANGTAEITVVLKDDGGNVVNGVDTSGPQTFTIVADPVNDAPSFTVGADQQAGEDAGPQTVEGWATDISAGPADESGQSLTFVVVDNTAPELFAAGPEVDPVTGTLTYTPAGDGYGEAIVTLQLVDDGGTAHNGVDTSAAQAFSITVAQSIFQWDGLGDGDWADVDAAGNSRWVDADGSPTALPPDSTTDTVITTDAVAVSADAAARDLSVESGAVVIAAGATLSLTGNLDMQEAAQLAVGVGGMDNSMIAADGDVQVAGTLSLQPVSGLGSIGYAVRTIVSGASVAGTFADMPAMGSHLGYGVFFHGIRYGADAVEVRLFQAAAGDTNGDGSVDLCDLQQILSAGSLHAGPGYDWTQGDFSGDTKVDSVDLQLILSTGLFGTGPYVEGHPDDGFSASGACGNAAQATDAALAGEEDASDEAVDAALAAW